MHNETVQTNGRLVCERIPAPEMKSKTIKKGLSVILILGLVGFGGYGGLTLV
jgi:hypothetical protein